MYKCKTCDFVTVRRGHLTRHELQHKEDVFACDKCHFRSTNVESVKKHKRSKHNRIKVRIKNCYTDFPIYSALKLFIRPCDQSLLAQRMVGGASWRCG